MRCKGVVLEDAVLESVMPFVYGVLRVVDALDNFEGSTQERSETNFRRRYM
jgi:hypothetical protein